MHFRNSALAAIAVLLLSLAPLAEAGAQPRVYGYHAWWMGDTWKELDSELYDKIFFFELRITGEAEVEDWYGWPGEWRSMVSESQAKGTRVVPTFAILDPAIFSKVLSSPSLRARLVETVLGAVRAGQADGAHLNFEVFEPVERAARDGLTLFARSLASALKAYRGDAELTIFLPGYDHGEAYDEYALSGIVDGLVVQGYDMHWLDGPTAGPVAPISGWEGANWNSIVDRFLALGVSPDRIVMTVPYFGYEWPTSGSRPGAATRGVGVPITYAPVDPDLLPLIRISATARLASAESLRDPVSDSPFYRYRGEDGWYQGWYEDARSLEAKYRFVKQRGLGGVAIFLLGYDGQRLDPALRKAFR